MQMAAETEGISGLELCYPRDFEDPESLKRLLASLNLGVSAINFPLQKNGSVDARILYFYVS